MIEFPGKASDFLKIGVAAAAKGDVDAVREILKARPKWLHRVGSHGRTMLWEASHRGRLPMVKYLVRRKANIDAFGTHYTPYFVEISCYCIARFKKHHQVADYLLDRGAIVDIHTLAFLGDLDGVKAELKQRRKRLDNGHPQYAMPPKDSGPDFVLEPASWATPLCYALRGGSVETVEYLIRRGAQVKGIEQALFIAADKNLPMVRALLEAGADARHAPDVYPDEGELYELVSSYGATTSNTQASEELVYLCRGDRGGNCAEAERLLAVGADVNHQDHKGKTALHRAARSGFVDTMKILIAKGATVDRTDPSGETPLFDAVRSTIKATDKRVAAITLLLQSGANPNHTNSKGESIADLLKDPKRPQPKAIKRLFT